jgi:hypothetical protein
MLCLSRVAMYAHWIERRANLDTLDETNASIFNTKFLTINLFRAMCIVYHQAIDHIKGQRSTSSFGRALALGPPTPYCNHNNTTPSTNRQDPIQDKNKTYAPRSPVPRQQLTQNKIPRSLRLSRNIADVLDPLLPLDCGVTCSHQETPW